MLVADYALNKPLIRVFRFSQTDNNLVELCLFKLLKDFVAILFYFCRSLDVLHRLIPLYFSQRDISVLWIPDEVDLGRNICVVKLVTALRFGSFLVSHDYSGSSRMVQFSIQALPRSCRLAPMVLKAHLPAFQQGCPVYLILHQVLERTASQLLHHQDENQAALYLQGQINAAFELNTAG